MGNSRDVNSRDPDVNLSELGYFPFAGTQLDEFLKMIPAEVENTIKSFLMPDCDAYYGKDCLTLLLSGTISPATAGLISQACERPLQPLSDVPAERS